MVVKLSTCLFIHSFISHIRHTGRSDESQSGNTVRGSVDAAVVDVMAGCLGVSTITEVGWGSAKVLLGTARRLRIWISGGWGWPRLYLDGSSHAACLTACHCRLAVAEMVRTTSRSRLSQGGTGGGRQTCGFLVAKYLCLTFRMSVWISCFRKKYIINW